MRFAVVFCMLLFVNQSCKNKDVDLNSYSTIIEGVSPLYLEVNEIANVSLAHPYNFYKETSLKIDGNPIKVNSIHGNVAEVVIPEATFSEKKYSAIVQYVNSRDTSKFEIYRYDFPRFDKLEVKSTNEGEELIINGDFLAPNSGKMTIWFTAKEDGKPLIYAEITATDNRRIAVKVPQDAGRSVFYFNTLGKEPLPRIINLGYFR
ncbi:MAG: hypothetical protein LBE37_03280 [Sphingobacterium sp.]|nr:hypothetical protein [Sphingobacterium sp.]